MLKRFVSVLLIAVFLLSVLLIASCSNEPNGTPGLQYELIEGKQEYCVTSMGSAMDENIVIADTYGGLPVTKIGVRAFVACTKIKSVTIPDSITCIGAYAFQDCANMQSVVIGQGVKEIQPYAFQDCVKLSSVEFKDTEQWILNNDRNKLASSNIADKAKVAIYLTDTYIDWIWYKT